MNDMIVEYKREIYKSVLTSKVVKVIDTFVPKHDGANWQNGFGYQLTGIANSDIKKITVESGGIVSQFMEGQDREPGQNYPTIILLTIKSSYKQNVYCNDRRRPRKIYRNGIYSFL